MVVFEFTDHEGAKKSRTIEGEMPYEKAKNKADAVIKAIEEFKDQRSKSASALAGRLPFPVYARNFLENDTSIVDTTRERYLQVLDSHILTNPAFQLDLRQITRRQITVHLKSLIKATSEGTTEIAHIVLCKIFENTVDVDEILEGNPARNLRKHIFGKNSSKRTEYKGKPLTTEQVNLFFSVAATICCARMLMLLKVLAYSGKRLGEGLALRVNCFDFVLNKCTISESYRRKKFGPLKSGKASHTFDLSPLLSKEIKAFIDELGLQGCALLFRDPNSANGLPYSQRQVQYALKKISKKAGLPSDLHPHDLRHTFATILLGKGENMQYMRKQLDHSTITTTVDLYSDHSRILPSVNHDEALRESFALGRH